MEFGTPSFVYDEATLRENARTVLNFPNAFGIFPRYAMKVAPTAAILRILMRRGLGIDASSVLRWNGQSKPVWNGIYFLSTQELADDFIYWAQDGIRVNLCSLHQIHKFGKWGKSRRVGLRFNPGKGSGGNNRTNVGGPASSFGIWKDDLNEAIKLCQEYKLTVERIHTHIDQSDPEVWKMVASMTLDLALLPSRWKPLIWGGGYKVARMPNEQATDLQEVGTPVKDLFIEFAKETGRELKLEIEPGTFFSPMPAAWSVRCRISLSTGPDGYRFLKLDSGMTEILRPSLYGAQHPIHLVCEPGQQKFRELWNGLW